MADPQLLSEVRALVGRQYGRVNAWDEVNAPMIRHWCEVIGLENPLYTDPVAAAKSCNDGIVAPPPMLQIWCMEGFHINNYAPGSTTENPYEVLGLIERYGYPSVVAVNSELTFERNLRLGEKLYYTTRLESVGDEKTTGLGTGFFVTLIMEYYAQQAAGDEKVGELLFRVFKFRPAQVHTAEQPAQLAPEPVVAKRPKPGVSDDTRYFWDGCKQGQLLIQRCRQCATLRHPPAPVCIACHSFEWDTLQASGKGQLYSFVVMHYPEVAPFDHPNPIGLIELDEGVRLIAGLVGVNREDLDIGQRMQVEFQTFDDDLVLPLFRPLAE
ncbi:OB-fold domain-containing protein [Pseudomonas kermanshahensis]|uniref:bifunctional MaoC family dehydratase N-terminal/OB-fold nucleic acid binding domain-containing protein n=1 Tax=Pseudomonas kermanshahensis TaxID=2745482 RepID=UPI0023DC32F1|nr:OB-fold domain-containing protein [Pseudomonas kermanshahensis]WEL57761.1 OB-fold domain-containing protein [Pseudomonas kermanshahensis]